MLAAQAGSRYSSPQNPRCNPVSGAGRAGRGQNGRKAAQGSRYPSGPRARPARGEAAHLETGDWENTRAPPHGP